MQSILSIDATKNPAQAVVLTIGDSRIEVAESKEIDLKAHFTRGFFHSPAASETGEEAPPSGDPSAAETAEIPDSNGSHPYPKALDAFRTPWTSSVVIMPTFDFVSLNVELPFQDSKSLSKIIDHDVQDRLPFELNDFLLQYQPLIQLENKQFDVHVGLIPKSHVGKMLGQIRSHGIEPSVLTTVGSTLAGVKALFGDSLAKNSAVFFFAADAIHVALFIDGQVRSEHVIDLLSLPGDSSGNDASGSAQIVSELKIALAAIERRYNQTLEKLYVLGTGIDLKELSQSLGKPAEALDLRSAIPSSHESNSLACLAALFARDESPPLALTNFRIREFAYRPQLTELIRGFRLLLPFMAALFATLAICIFGTYMARKEHIRFLRQTIRDQAIRIIPDLTMTPGNEITALSFAKAKVENELKSLGSPSKYSPLDYLAEISRDLSSVQGVKVNSILIRDGKAKIEGISPSYDEVEKLKRKLEHRKDKYCDVKRDMGKDSPSGAGRSFSMDIALCP